MKEEIASAFVIKCARKAAKEKAAVVNRAVKKVKKNITTTVIISVKIKIAENVAGVKVTVMVIKNINTVKAVNRPKNHRLAAVPPAAVCVRKHPKAAAPAPAPVPVPVPVRAPAPPRQRWNIKRRPTKANRSIWSIIPRK